MAQRKCNMQIKLKGQFHDPIAVGTDPIQLPCIEMRSPFISFRCIAFPKAISDYLRCQIQMDGLRQVGVKRITQSHLVLITCTYCHLLQKECDSTVSKYCPPQLGLKPLTPGFKVRYFIYQTIHSAYKKTLMERFCCQRYILKGRYKADFFFPVRIFRVGL